MNDQNTTSRACGRITGLYGDVLQGWALDPAKPDLRLVVEIYIDGSSVAFAHANEFHPGANSGDDFNGFAVQLRESWLAGGKIISARIANQEEWMEGTIQLPAPAPIDPAPAASQVWHTGGLKVSGWAFDATDPNRAVTVTVREGTHILATVTADRLHHALAYKASRHHGFELDLPWALADGNIHTLEVHNDLGQALSGSPLTLCCWPEGVEALLRNNAESIGDKAKSELLAQVARHQELLLPKSAGFHHYPEWFEVFQKPEPLDSRLKGKCGVLIISEGHPDKDAISIQSVRQQRHSPHAIEVTDASDVLPSLKRLIEQGCESIIPVSSGDRLASHALDRLLPLLKEDIAWAYGDCDRDEVDGSRSAPWLKPIWDIDLFVGADVFSPGAIFTATTLTRVTDPTFAILNDSKLEWHALLARIALYTEQSDLDVAHLPYIVYHRHHILSACPSEAMRSEAREIAMSWLVNLLSEGASIEHIAGFPGLLRTRWPLPGNLPKVSIIIPTRDHLALLKKCIEGVLMNTDYNNLEVIVVDNDSTDPGTLTYLNEIQELGVVVIRYPFAFNYAAVNNRAADVATGQFVCLLNNDIEILEKDWLKELVSHGIRNGVGAVGAKLLWPNNMVQHGGVVIGINGLAAHAGNHLQDGDAGYMGLNQLTHLCSAVTGACLLIPRLEYLDQFGMNEVFYPVAFNDVDLCLRIGANNYKIVWSAHAKLVHAESASRGKDVAKERRARAGMEQMNFIRSWTITHSGDPHYHPALSTDYLAGPYSGFILSRRLDQASRSSKKHMQRVQSFS
ncbi:glycosyltransferase family 2 protein [Pseudomonas sp. CFBP 13719]|uniref:glycosyltransferase family 2 protein n=1 Tax=Pseudomonas sp. CFBP 13719 TaxID=2775303 RepID=UPI0017837636|nr:glycosyltransferase [Pseudomonas sp. CFBP 13719]MBD8684815.1 glycosyltransferase [Pseudomonas sp. CFBP 13719]